MPLSDARCRNANPQPKPYKLSDGGGMYLLVKPDGARYWRMDYRLHGKRKTLAIGVYPDVSLARAREERGKARSHVAAGRDPVVEKQSEKRAARVSAENTFKAVAEELLGKFQREGRSPVTLNKKRWLLSFAEREMGNRPISEITAPDLLAVLREVERRGHYETANRLRSFCGSVFRYAIATGRAQRDPSGDLRGALATPAVKHHAAITDPKAVGALLRAIDGYLGHPVTLAALQFAPLVFVRPGELRHAEWREVDVDRAMWSIPAPKMKMNRSHLVPLSRQALAILQKLEPTTGRGRYLFPSIRSASRPMSENTVNAALRRLGYTVNEMTGHGFRSMAAVRLNEMGKWSADAIERQLAHQEPNAVRRAYTSQAEYLDERRRMMQSWADYLDVLKNGAEIVQLNPKIA